jgi:hypothetical protein
MTNREVSVSRFKMLSQNLAGESEKKHGSFQVRSRSVGVHTQMFDILCETILNHIEILHIMGPNSRSYVCVCVCVCIYIYNENYVFRIFIVIDIVFYFV